MPLPNYERAFLLLAQQLQQFLYRRVGFGFAVAQADDLPFPLLRAGRLFLGRFAEARGEPAEEIAEVVLLAGRVFPLHQAQPFDFAVGRRGPCLGDGRDPVVDIGSLEGLRLRVLDGAAEGLAGGRERGQPLPARAEPDLKRGRALRAGERSVVVVGVGVGGRKVAEQAYHSDSPTETELKM